MTSDLTKMSVSDLSDPKIVPLLHLRILQIYVRRVMASSTLPFRFSSTRAFRTEDLSLNIKSMEAFILRFDYL